MVKYFNGRQNICHGAMAYFGMYIKIIDQTIETISPDLREGFFCELAGAELPPLIRVAKPLEFAPDKQIVELDIVRYKNTTFCNFDYISCYFIKIGGIRYHFIGDARQVTDKWGDTYFGIDQRLECIDYFFTVMDRYSYLGGMVVSGSYTRGCDVHYRR